MGLCNPQESSFWIIFPPGCSGQNRATGSLRNLLLLLCSELCRSSQALPHHSEDRRACLFPTLPQEKCDGGHLAKTLSPPYSFCYLSVLTLLDVLLRVKGSFTHPDTHGSDSECRQKQRSVLSPLPHRQALQPLSCAASLARTQRWQLRSSFHPTPASSK